MIPESTTHAKNTRESRTSFKFVMQLHVFMGGPGLVLSHTYIDYLSPAMGCCASRAAKNPEDSQPARNDPATVQVPIPTPPASALHHSPSNSSRRTRTRSQHPMHRSTETPDILFRSRVTSALQRVTKSSSSQRANTTLGPRASRSTPGPRNRGEGDSLAGPTMNSYDCPVRADKGGGPFTFLFSFSLLNSCIYRAQTESTTTAYHFLVLMLSTVYVGFFFFFGIGS